MELLRFMFVESNELRTTNGACKTGRTLSSSFTKQTSASILGLFVSKLPAIVDISVRLVRAEVHPGIQEEANAENIKFDDLLMSVLHSHEKC